MSSSSTRKSTSRTRKRRRIHHITLVVWQNFGEPRPSVTLPPELAENTQVSVRIEQQDGTLKFSEPLFDFITASGDRYLQFHPSSSRQSPSPATDGSYEKRLRAYYAARGIPRIFADLSYLEYIRGRERGHS